VKADALFLSAVASVFAPRIERRPPVKAGRKQERGDKRAACDLYAKRNIKVLGRIWHRMRPMPWQAEKLSGYASRKVNEIAEFLKLINHQIQKLGKELLKTGKEDPQAIRLITILESVRLQLWRSVAGSARSKDFLVPRDW